MSLLRLTLPAPAAPSKKVLQRFLVDRLKSLIARWSRVVTSLDTNPEATQFAASSLPYMKRSLQVSHEGSNNRAWPRESRHPRAVCPLSDQGLKVITRHGGNPSTFWIETGEKPVRSLPLRLPPMACGLGNTLLHREAQTALASQRSAGPLLRRP
jgi:hypothetical protein